MLGMARTPRGMGVGRLITARDILRLGPVGVWGKGTDGTGGWTVGDGVARVRCVKDAWAGRGRWAKDVERVTLVGISCYGLGDVALVCVSLLFGGWAGGFNWVLWRAAQHA